MDGNNCRLEHMMLLPAMENKVWQRSHGQTTGQPLCYLFWLVSA